jgi:adenylate kinase
VIEVAELALELGAGERTGTAVEVDLAHLRDRFRTWRSRPADLVVVGHLAHLLPIRDVVLLRCHPAELARRLRRAGGRSVLARQENVVAEAIDLILGEAVAARRRVWEVDTTARPPEEVARVVERLLSRRPPPRRGIVDWLADPGVTVQLLGGDP